MMIRIPTPLSIQESLRQQEFFRNANVSVVIRFLSTKSYTSWDAYRVNRLPVEPWHFHLRSEGLESELQ